MGPGRSSVTSPKRSPCISFSRTKSVDLTARGVASRRRHQSPLGNAAREWGRQPTIIGWPGRRLCDSLSVNSPRVQSGFCRAAEISYGFWPRIPATVPQWPESNRRDRKGLSALAVGLLAILVIVARNDLEPEPAGPGFAGRLHAP
jgi:hypothetical protein